MLRAFIRAAKEVPTKGEVAVGDNNSLVERKISRFGATSAAIIVVVIVAVVVVAVARIIVPPPAAAPAATPFMTGERRPVVTGCGARGGVDAPPCGVVTGDRNDVL